MRETMSESFVSSAQQPLRLLFIHHSCGGQWLAPVGPDRHTACIYETAENGGGLRDRLTTEGYEVHEASYNSRVGDQTDIFHWSVKFRDQMEEVLKCDHQDVFYKDSRRNDIVVFKSCFPNNSFVDIGRAPGDPNGPELTVENAKAAYRSLLGPFSKVPNVLFVSVTAPPLAFSRTARYKAIAKRLLGRRDIRSSGPLARQFNNWLKDPDQGWLASYHGVNVAVFDLYDTLTDYGRSDFCTYPSGRRRDDSHPNSAGNGKATDAFVAFLHRVVRREG